ncbi:MAG TPA: hypothetical protein VGO70_03905 [Arsenicitalea sp.]|jgi:hypothetical protein|nr:hypothetical protein [Arsenicitalea sp.]
MSKKSVIALATLAILAGAAVPAFAKDSIFGSGPVADQQDVQQGIVQQLNQKGIRATSVEEWGDYIRAYVTLADGTHVQEFFTPGSLQQVKL